MNQASIVRAALGGTLAGALVSGAAFSRFPSERPSRAGAAAPVLRSLPTPLPGRPAEQPRPAVVLNGPAPNATLKIVSEFLGKDGQGQPRRIENTPHRVRFVVATLPDPVDSHFGSAFDRGLEAIVAAASDAGYSLDRWSLHWRPGSPAPPQPVWAADASGRVVLAAAPPLPGVGADGYRSIPGAVLFRGPRDELLVLFLVGETPTQGLHKDAFVAAVGAFREFRHDHASALRSDVVSVLGPYFSGSATSLSVVLASAGVPYRLISGSATSDRNPGILGPLYQTTTWPDGALTTALFRYFADIGVDAAEDVAFLVEDGTAYGDDFVGRSETGPLAGTRDGQDAPLAHLEAGAAPAASSVPPEPKLRMRFPLQIAQIRGAYEKRESARRAATAAGLLPRNLEISLEGPDDPRDALPPYESRMTASVAELVLSNVFDTLRRQRIRYLGLVASDTRDVLFLARKAREFGSDAVLFTFGNDVVYHHPEALPALDGLLVVTTYPLLGYQTWQSPPRGALQRSFAGSAEQGIYNAAVSLVERLDLLRDYGDGRRGRPQPAVWIVANARDGFWPVWVWRADPPSAGSLSPPPYPEMFSPLGPDKVSSVPPVAAPAPATPSRSYGSFLPVPPAMLVLLVTWSIVACALVAGWRRYRLPDSTSIPLASAGSVPDRLRMFFSACSTRGEPCESHLFVNLASMAALFFVVAVVEAALVAAVARWELLREEARYAFESSTSAPAPESELIRGALEAFWQRLSVGDVEYHALGLWALALLGSAITVFALAISLAEAGQFLRTRGRALAEIRDAARRGFRASARALPPSERRALARRVRGEATGKAREARLAFGFHVASLVLFLVFGILAAWFAADAVVASRFHAFLVLNRSFALGSRSGPLLPMCLGGVVLALFAASQVRRSVLYEEQRYVAPAEPKPPQSLLALLEPYTAFTRLARNPFDSPLTSIGPLLGVLVFHAIFVGAGWYRSFDGHAWNALSTFLMSACVWCVARSVLDFRETWRRLTSLLRILSWSPLADAFNRMPDGLAKSHWRMWRVPPTLTSMHVSVSHLRTLVSLGRDPQVQKLDDGTVDAQRKCDEVFTEVLRRAHEGHASTQAQRKKLRTLLARATLGVCQRLESEWGGWPSKADIKDRTEKDHQETLSTVVWLRRQMPSPPDVFVRIAEEYVAVRFVSFIHYAFSHMRNSLSYALAGFVLLMALIGSYPFQPYHPVVGMAWVLGLLGIAGVVWTFLDMERDLILSYIGKTRPGHVEVNFELVTSLFVYAVIPLVTLLATQFPDLGDAIVSALNPAMKIR